MVKLTLMTMVWAAASFGAPCWAVSQTLVYGETGRIDSYDAYTSHEASAQRIADLIFDGLFFAHGNGHYEPLLAKTWEPSTDGSSVTFFLRDDVQWHPDPGNKRPGEKFSFSAKDVAVTVRLLQAKESEIPNQERFQAIDRVEVEGPHKVTIHLARASLDPLRALSFKILPAHVFSKEKALRRNHPFVKAPVGTGPYRFATSNEQGEVKLVANEAYFKGKPQIPEMLMKSYADQSVMSQSLMFKALDFITYVSPRDMGEISGDRLLSLVPYDALSFSFFALNTSRGVLQNKEVRQAINFAINRQEMLQAFFAGKGQIISGPFAPSSWAYNLDVAPYAFDQKRSRELLERAGLQNRGGFYHDAQGNLISLKFVVPLAGENDMIKRVVLAFQGYLNQVGVKTELQFMDWLVWKQRVLGEHDYDVTFASWSFDDASNITSLFHSSSAEPWGNNFVLYRNPQVDALLTEAQTTNDFDKRRAINQRLHAILADEAPYTYLWTLQHHAAHGAKVGGVRVEPYSLFKHVSSWQLKEQNGGG